jgi:maleate isomerase
MPIRETEINDDALQKLADELLVAMNASRITIRLDVPEVHPYFPVFGEATVLGVRPLKDEAHTHTGLPQAPTFLYVQNEKKILVQEDVTTSPPAFPELVDDYGIRAQLLAPIIKDGELVGVVSVHYADGPRKWSDAEFKTLHNLSARVHRELGLDVPEIYR